MSAFTFCLVQCIPSRVNITLIFITLKWVDLHSNKIIMIEKEIYMPVSCLHIHFGDGIFRHLSLKISVTAD